MAPETWIALLGRRDEPVDGVVDYCSFLAVALAPQGVILEQHFVDWAGRGWFGALRDLDRQARDWRGRWVMVQYTALGWSRRGFPLGLLLAVRRLRRRGARVGVVFHEPERQTGGVRFIDRIRGAFQDWVIACLYARAEVAIFADALETIPWLPPDRSKAVFIPIGANIPATASLGTLRQDQQAAETASTAKQRLTIAIYCLSPLPNRERELRDIARALQAAAAEGAPLRAVFLGRGTEDTEEVIRRAISKDAADVQVLGLQHSEAISRTLAQSDVMLSVRGPLFPRRGSVIAGIACGLPIVAYSNGKSAFPLSESGIELVPWHEPERLAATFARLACDPQRRESLRAKSLEAYEEFFSWRSIAEKYVTACRAAKSADSSSTAAHESFERTSRKLKT